MKKFVLFVFSVFCLIIMASCGEAKINQFNIKFMQDDNTTVLYEYKADENSQIEYKGATPTKAEDASYTYTFSSWDHELGKAVKDETFVATYTKTEKTIPTPDPVEEKVDVLNATVLGGSGNQYKAWTFESSTGAVWTGCTAFGHKAIQLRSRNSDSALLVTTSAGSVKSVTIKYNSATATPRSLNLFGYNEVIESVQEFYEAELEPIYTFNYTSKDSLEFSYTFTENFGYIAFASAQDAQYIDEIKVTWKEAEAPKSAEPADKALEDAFAELIASSNYTYNYSYKGTGDFTDDVAQTSITLDGTKIRINAYDSELDEEYYYFIYTDNGIRYLLFEPTEENNYDDIDGENIDWDNVNFDDLFGKRRVVKKEANDTTYVYITDADPSFDDALNEVGYIAIDFSKLVYTDFEKIGENRYRIKEDKLQEVAKSIIGDNDFEGETQDYYGDDCYAFIKETIKSLNITLANGKISKITIKSNYKETIKYSEDDVQNHNGDFSYTIEIKDLGNTSIKIPEATVYIEEPKVISCYKLNQGDKITLDVIVNNVNRDEKIIYVCDETAAIAVLLNEAIDEDIKIGSTLNITGTVKITGELVELEAISVVDKTEELEDMVNYKIESLKGQTSVFAGETIDFNYLTLTEKDIENKNVVFTSYDNEEYKLIFNDTEKEKVAQILDSREPGIALLVKSLAVSIENDKFVLRLLEDTAVETSTGVVVNTLDIEKNVGTTLEEALADIKLFVYQDGVKSEVLAGGYTYKADDYNKDLASTYLVEISKDDFKKVVAIRLKNDAQAIESFKEANVKGIEFATKRYGVNVGMPSVGDVNILVIPVSFTNQEIPANYKETLEKGFNGTSEETGWHSLKSYYETVSYNKLHLNATILDVYETGDEYHASNTQVGEKSYPEEFYDSYISLDEKYLDKAIAKYNDVIDYSNYDANNDGFIDCVYLVYLAPYCTNKGSLDTWWAYTTNFHGKIENNDFVKDEYDDLKLDCYLWFSIDFFSDPIEGVKINSETVIHESGHAMGLDDYYDTTKTGTNGGYGGGIMMDRNCGDHDPFSKALLNWINPEIVINSDTTIDLASFEKTGDAIFIAKDYDGVMFNEFYIIDYYTPTGVNELKAGTDGLPSVSGIRILHATATPNERVFIDSIWTIPQANNSIKDNKLLEVVEADQSSLIGDNTVMQDTDLWKENDKVEGLKWRDGSECNFTINIQSVSLETATIFVDFK